MNWLKYKFLKARGSWRVFLGLCPMCNSDAPELYDCPLCDYYHGPFPPSKELKDEWLEEYRMAINTKDMVDSLVQEFRASRKER